MQDSSIIKPPTFFSIIRPPQEIKLERRSEWKLPLRSRITCRQCRQPKLPNYLYSSNITSWRLIRQANNNNKLEEALIPRIEIRHQEDQFIEWNRRQFPVRPDFAMTIKKIQDQTQKMSLARGTCIHSWAALCRGVKISRPSTSSPCCKQ